MVRRESVTEPFKSSVLCHFFKTLHKGLANRIVKLRRESSKQQPTFWPLFDAVILVPTLFHFIALICNLKVIAIDTTSVLQVKFRK